MNKVQEVLVNIWSQFTDSSEQNIEDELTKSLVSEKCVVHKIPLKSKIMSFGG